MATEFTTANFESEVVQSSVPVLVDFWAPWCGPCRMIGPVIDELHGEAGDRFKVGKINVDEQPDLAQKYGISAIPTLLVFQGGNVVETFQGVQNKQALLDALEEAAAKA